MRKLLNTLYVFSEDLYLALDGENVVAKRSGTAVSRIPLHTLESIQTFSYAGASPALMGECAERGIELSFFDQRGRFLVDVQGRKYGNVLLRKRQVLVSEDERLSLPIARNFILGKVFNCRWVLERACRDHSLRVDTVRIKEASKRLAGSLKAIRGCESIDSLRGIEGDAAAVYFSVFDELILNNDETFLFSGRNKRPPRDAVNAMLSLFYTTLSLDCSSALQGVGLDPYIGFMHTDRPGRRSLALDLMEELRPIFVDRFVISAINNRMVNKDSFITRETDEVYLSDKARKTLYDAWQKRKRETISHPFLKEKMPRGLVSTVQAQLLAKYVRNDLDAYPPFLWK